ncbi:hypothetical protein J6590_025867 [Homalodisca vitripennis]|nr:hypothetical protein J6590_025867 [Homalodisca vitripennis]
MAQGPFPIQSPSITVYRQQLWVIAVMQTDNSDDEVYEKPFQVSISIEGISPGHKKIPVMRSDRYHNRTRHLRCAKQTCEPVTVLHLGYLYFSRYLFTVHLYGLQSFHKLYHIREINFFMSGEESADFESLINQIVNDRILAIEEENAHLRQEVEAENVRLRREMIKVNVCPTMSGSTAGSIVVRHVPVPSKLKLDGNMKDNIQHCYYLVQQLFLSNQAL